MAFLCLAIRHLTARLTCLRGLVFPPRPLSCSPSWQNGIFAVLALRNRCQEPISDHSANKSGVRQAKKRIHDPAWAIARFVALYCQNPPQKVMNLTVQPQTRLRPIDQSLYFGRKWPACLVLRDDVGAQLETLSSHCPPAAYHRATASAVHWEAKH